jgi:hypothetical protein
MGDLGQQIQQARVILHQQYQQAQQQLLDNYQAQDLALVNVLKTTRNLIDSTFHVNQQKAMNRAAVISNAYNANNDPAIAASVQEEQQGLARDYRKSVRGINTAIEQPMVEDDDDDDDEHAAGLNDDDELKAIIHTASGHTGVGSKKIKTCG